MDDDAAEQLEMDRQTWAALREQGVVPGSDLGVDAFFFAPAQAAAEQLAADLESLGWTVAVSSPRQGLLKRRSLWALQASRVFRDIHLQTLDEMVTSLQVEAARHGAEFDGWGAEVPGDDASRPL